MAEIAPLPPHASPPTPTTPVPSGAPPPPRHAASPPPAAPIPSALPDLEIAPGLDGAFSVKGSALAGPKLTPWDYFVDALIRFFTFFQADTRAFGHKVDSVFWESAALQLLVGCKGEPLSEEALQAVLKKLQIALEREHGPAYHAADITKIVGNTIREIETTLTPSQTGAFLAAMADPHFSARGEVLDLLSAPANPLKNFWPAVASLVQSQAFAQAAPVAREQMLATLSKDVDRTLVGEGLRELSALSLVMRAEPVPFAIGPTHEIGTHAYEGAGVSPSVTAVLTFGTQKIPVNAPRHKGAGYRVSVETVAAALALMPPLLRERVHEVDMSPVDMAIASTRADGSGIVTVYNQARRIMEVTAAVANDMQLLPRILALVIAHEVGHDLTLGPHGIDEKAWDEAVAHDLTWTTQYGSTSHNEEMAEVFKFYAFSVGTPYEKKYRSRWPARFALLDRMVAAIAADKS